MEYRSSKCSSLLATSTLLHRTDYSKSSLSFETVITQVCFTVTKRYKERQNRLKFLKKSMNQSIQKCGLDRDVELLFTALHLLIHSDAHGIIGCVSITIVLSAFI